MKQSTEPPLISAAVKYATLLAFVLSLCEMLAAWVWLLEILQPSKWLLPANIGKWTIVLIYAIFVIPFFVGRIFAKKKTTLFQRKHLSLLFYLPTIFALVLNRLDAALILTYCWRVAGSIKSLKSGPNKEMAETPFFLWIEASLRLLSASAFIAAFVCHSFPLALVVFGLEALNWLIGLLQLPTMLPAAQMQFDEKKPSQPACSR